MSMLQRHTDAFQAAGTLALLTAAITALPLLASNQFEEPYYANNIVTNFQRIGAQGSEIYSNGSLGTSGFDFALYFSDTCYRPTEFDMPTCAQKYGPYANLKTTYDSGQLAAILRRVPYLAATAALLPQSAAVSSSSSSSTSSSSTSSSSSQMSSSSSPYSYSNSASSETTPSRNDRAGQLWSVCVKEFPGRQESAMCYQRNIRLINDRIEEITPSVVY